MAEEINILRVKETTLGFTLERREYFCAFQEKNHAETLAGITRITKTFQF